MAGKYNEASWSGYDERTGGPGKSSKVHLVRAEDDNQYGQPNLWTLCGVRVPSNAFEGYSIQDCKRCQNIAAKEK